MKIKLQIYILGKVMSIEGVLMLLPVLCGLIYSEYRNTFVYLVFAAFYIAAGNAIASVACSAEVKHSDNSSVMHISVAGIISVYAYIAIFYFCYSA